MECQKCHTAVAVSVVSGSGEAAPCLFVAGFFLVWVRRARAAPVTEMIATVLLLALICCNDLTGPLLLVGRRRSITPEPALAWCEMKEIDDSLTC